MTAEACQMKIRAMTWVLLKQLSSFCQYPGRNFFVSPESMMHLHIPRCFIVSFIALLVAAIAGSRSAVRREDVASWAKSHQADLVELYKYFHTHPELSFEEFETASRVAKELRAAGIDVTEG